MLKSGKTEKEWNFKKVNLSLKSSEITHSPIQGYLSSTKDLWI